MYIYICRMLFKFFQAFILDRGKLQLLTLATLGYKVLFMLIYVNKY